MDKVVHFEIPAVDMGRAQKFYKSVFGWEMSKAPGEMEYYMVNTVKVDKNHMPLETGAINGGMMDKGTGQTSTPYPVIVLNVPSVDKYIKKIQTSGGKLIMPAQKMMDMGIYARVQDTEGNLIGIWEDLKKTD